MCSSRTGTRPLPSASPIATVAVPESFGKFSRQMVKSAVSTRKSKLKSPGGGSGDGKKRGRFGESFVARLRKNAVADESSVEVVVGDAPFAVGEAENSGEEAVAIGEHELLGIAQVGDRERAVDGAGGEVEPLDVAGGEHAADIDEAIVDEQAQAPLSDVAEGMNTSIVGFGLT